MKLELYNLSGEKIQVLKNSSNSIVGEARNIVHTIELNGQQELTFILDVYIVIDGQEQYNERWNQIISEQLLKLTTNDGDIEYFRIKSTTDQHNNNGVLTSNIQCKHKCFDLTSQNINKSFDKTGTALELMQEIMSGSIWTIGSVDSFLQNGSEKIRTLRTSSTSNTLDHLQQVAELVEGYLKFDSVNNQVSLLKELGNTNTGIQFRYQKNLKEVSCNINSDSIITKLFCEGGTTEIGVVNISEVNPETKEIYRLNFDYFINSGLMPVSTQEKIAPFKSHILAKNNEIITLQNEVNALQTQLDAKNNQLSPRKAEKITVDEFVADYTTKISSEKDADKLAEYQYLLNRFSQRQEGLIYGDSYYGVGTCKITNGSDQILFNDILDYATLIRVDDTIVVNGQSKKILELLGDNKIKVDSPFTETLNYLTFTINPLSIQSLVMDISNLEYQIWEKNGYISFKLEDKAVIEQQFSADMGDFLREGRWSDSNYVDSQKLFDGSTEVLSRVSQPKISYTMSIVDLANYSDEYNLERFKIGDTIQVVDDLLNLNVIVRITRIVIDYDNPFNTTVEIANYASLNEMFNKINSTSNIIDAKSKYWNNIETALDGNGNIRSSVLQSAFDNNKYLITSGANNDVVLDKNGLTIYDTSSPYSNGIYQNMLRATAGILAISDDFGMTFDEAITARGINASMIKVGNLDVSNINIIGTKDDNDFVSFVWNYSGQYALNPDFPNKWIRFNKDGLFATEDNGSSFIFELGWNGLKINPSGVTGLESFMSVTSSEIASKVSNGVFESYVSQTATEISSKVSNGVFESYQTQTATEIASKVSNGTFSSYVSQTSTEISSKVSNGDYISYVIQTASEISSKVSSTDYNGNNIVSMINQSSSQIEMSALNIDLTGYVTFNSLSQSGQTTINGANITTGVINSNRISTVGLGAEKIYMPSNSNNYGSIGGSYGDLILYYGGSEYFRIYNGLGYVDLQANGTQFIGSSGSNTTAYGNWEFSGNIGFFGATPTTQRSVTSLPSGCTTEDMRIKINGIMNHLALLGLFVVS